MADILACPFPVCHVVMASLGRYASFFVPTCVRATWGLYASVWSNGCQECENAGGTCDERSDKAKLSLFCFGSINWCSRAQSLCQTMVSHSKTRRRQISGFPYHMANVPYAGEQRLGFLTSPIQTYICGSVSIPSNSTYPVLCLSPSSYQINCCLCLYLLPLAFVLLPGIGLLHLQVFGDLQLASFLLHLLHELSLPFVLSAVASAQQSSSIPSDFDLVISDLPLSDFAQFQQSFGLSFVSSALALASSSIVPGSKT